MEGIFTEINFELEALVSAEDFQLPFLDFQLSNYPNPFNPTTTIYFNLTTESMELIIYNIKGQQIRQYSIFNNQSSVIWDGTDNNNQPVGSGIYFYKLKSGDFEKTRKMILLK